MSRTELEQLLDGDKHTQDKINGIMTKLKGKLPSGYILNDISDEQYREVISNGNVYRIDNPVALIIRPGGSTHRVVDIKGVVHCYADPSLGKSVIRWKSKELVSF